MVMKISLSDDIAEHVQSCAEARGISPDQFVSDIVTRAIKATESFPLEKLVAQIRNMAPNPAGIRPAHGSLLEILQSGPTDPNFDQEAWQLEWAIIEAEMKAVTRVNDIAEGRS